MAGKIRTLSVDMFPVGNKCNLQCKYCNTAFLSNNNDNANIISQNLLVNILKQLGQFDIENLQIHWTGGEPLIAGIDFYKKVLELEKKYIKNINVYNTMNTNGILLTERVLEFLKASNFSVALSVDGKDYNQNEYRFKNTKLYTSLLEKLAMFRSIDYPLWIQMVVSQKNYNDAQGIFSWLKTLGTKALSIYPSFHKHKGMLSDLTITNSQYATFLIEMFDLWIKNKRPFRINLYNDVLAGLNFQKYRLCYLSGNCSSMNIDNSGNIFDSCVHQTQETWLGHVTSSDFRELFNEHLRRSTKGLNNTDIVEIMRQDTYSYRFSKDKVCYQFGQNGSFYFMRAIWQLNKHINLLLKGIRNDEEGTAKNIRKS